MTSEISEKATTPLPISPPSKKSDISDPFAPFPTAAYSAAALSFTITAFSFGFYGFLAKEGGIPAPSSVVNQADNYPRASVQLVALLSTFLAMILNAGLEKILMLVAQKRFLKHRTIFEAEVWAYLKNRGILIPTLSWPLSQISLARWGATPITLIRVGLCGALTAAFVSLLSPLRITVVEKFPAYMELDLSAARAAGPCRDWYNKNLMTGRNETCPTWTTNSLNFTYQRCDTTSQILDVLEAGKASMLAYIDSQIPPSKDTPSSIAALARFGNTRIVGSTKGVIPTGFAGIASFNDKSLAVRSSLSNTRFAPKPNYTLTLQGLPVDVSCNYIDYPELPHYHNWPPKLNATQGAYFVNYTCATAWDGSGFNTAQVVKGNNGLLIFSCRSADKKYWDYYLHSYFLYSEAPLNSTLPEGPAYAGIGAMKCTVTPRLHAITATFNSTLDAFTMKPENDNFEEPNIGPGIFVSVDRFIWFIFANAQTPYAGNLLAYLVDTWAVSRFHLPGGQTHPSYPGAVASFLTGVFEYQASYHRLLFEFAPTRAEDQCYREVVPSVKYFATGWEATLATSLGLVPTGLVVIITLTLLVYGLMLGEKLPNFDPTSPVSLIAAASARGVMVKPENVGHPEDDDIRSRQVIYDVVAVVDGRTKQYGLTTEKWPQENPV